MISTRSVALAPALWLVMAVGSMPSLVFAQSARPAELTGALMGLHHEFPGTLHKITPELLSLQAQLVDELRAREAGIREQERVGQRTTEDVVNATESYFRELETLQVMTARSKKRSVTEREILKIRIDVRSQALSVLKRDSDASNDRFAVGEVHRTDAAQMKARALKAAVMLEALKNAAGLPDANRGGSATVVPK